MRLFLFKHLGQRQVVLGMLEFPPECAATRQQPQIQLGEGAEALPGRILPKPPPAILDVLLNNPFSYNFV